MSSTISVIICAYTEERWKYLVAAVESVQHQTLPPKEIIVVADHNSPLLQRILSTLPGVTAIESTEGDGIQGARNCGIAIAQGQVIAFLDDDAAAFPEWLQSLSEGYAETDVLGIGGQVIPYWMCGKVSWWPEEFLWVISGTYRGMPQTKAAVRNLPSVNLSFRREVLARVGNFQAEVGEDTELCIRVHKYYREGKLLYLPQARVLHNVPCQRASWSYFWRRCYFEGFIKTRVTHDCGLKEGLKSEFFYTLHTLPRGILRDLTDAFVYHDWSGFSRAAAIVGGFTATLVGYLVGHILLLFAPSRSLPLKKKMLS
jgi:glycosyltransferase involved in cell wall biosynthesis